MDRYYTFNADKFLKDSKSKWRTERKELEKKLKSITELKAIENSEVHTSNISDPTASASIKRMEIEKEIERIDRYEKLLEYAFDNLSDYNRDILKRWYYTNKSINKIVDDIANESGGKPRQVYNWRREALETFSRLIEEGEMLW